MRTLLIALAVLAAALVAAVLLAPSLIDGDDLKRTLAAEVEAATGRKLTIDGDVSVELLPTPALELASVRLANLPGAAAPDMVRLRALRVEVALWPLLSSRVEVRRLVLVEPVVELERLADGRTNWVFTPPSRPATPAVNEGVPGRAAGSDKGFAVQLDDVRIARGAVVWRTAGAVQRIEGIDATVAASSLDGPFRFDGKLGIAGVPADVRISVGQLRVDRAAPVSVNVAAAGATAELQGLLSGWPVAPKVGGRIAVRAVDPAVVAAVTGAGALPPAIGSTPLEIDAQLSASADAVAVNDMTLRFGAVSGTGAIDVALGNRPSANVVLNLARVDLDALLAPGAAPSPTAGGAPAAPRPPVTPARPERPLPTLPTLPKDFDATVELKVDAITWRGAIVRQTQLVASLAAGELTLSQAAALLPGSSDVSAFGFVTLGESGPAFDGQIEANSDNLRGLLGWLGTDVGAVPAERLRKLALAATVKATRTDLTLTDVDVTVDTSRIRGGVAVAMRERPGFGVGLSVDRVNLDAYRPAAGPAGATAGGGAGTPGAAAAAATASDNPLAVLDRFDAIVQMKAGAVTWNGQQYAGLSLDGTLQGGALDLRDASVEDFAGASVRLAGTLSGVETGAPSADVRLAVKAPDPERVARALGAALPLPLGAADLDVGLRGSLAQGADIDAKLVAQGAEATVKGRVGDLLTAAPSLDLTVALNHPDGSRLLGALTGAAVAEGAGALKFAGTAKGTLAALDLDTTLALGAANLAVAGHLDGLQQGAPAGSLRVSAAHPDFAAAARMLAPGWRPALARPGALKLAADVKLAPGRIDAGAIDGEFGPVKVNGQATWDTTGPRPKLVADLQTSEVVLDWFLAPVAPAGAAGGGGAGGGTAPAANAPSDDGERWPRTAIDFGRLRAVDASLTLTAPAASQGDLRIETPKVVATLSDGVFDLRELTGKVYGGTLAMQARVDAKAAPARVSASMRIAGADAAAMADAGHGGGARTMGGLLELVFPVSAVTLAAGTLGADFNIESRGGSPFELVSNLSGKVGVSFVDAVVSGIDACRVSKQLDSIRGLQGFLDLAGSTRGGRTRIGNFETSFGIARGVAVLPEQTITAECSAVTIKGTVDLPRWLVDMQTRARLTEHRNFPGVLVEEKGTLDQPNIRVVNLNELQQYVAGKGVETIIRNLAPGQQQAPQQQAPRQQAPQQQAPQQSPQQQRPADRFNDILQDFLKTPR
ncbi:MAG: AsmA family protein [Alphaproteobacteria bacterium]